MIRRPPATTRRPARALEALLPGLALSLLPAALPPAGAGEVVPAGEEEAPPRPDRRPLPLPELPREIRAARVARGPVVDGRLDDDAWKGAEIGGPLVQVIPIPGDEPTEWTEFRIVYDEHAIYIGVWCFDRDPQGIIAREMAREGRIGIDDYVIVVLDTFRDRRNGYYFRVNPNGAREDALITNNVELNMSWDGIWEAEGSIDGEGWKLEIAIPFKTLSFDPDSDTWGFNLTRSIKRKAERDRWSSAAPEIDTYNVAEAGTVTGLSGLRQGLGIDIVPYVLSKHRYQSADSDQDLVFEAGGDARYRITPYLQASLSYNTDFAETEVDARQVNLTRFPLFFPEKRDFFLEDAGIFSFGGLGSELIPFFSRRIGLSRTGEPVPIALAGKLTGRINSYNIGLIDAVLDEHDDLGIKNALVARVSKNILDQSTVGMIATHGDPNSDDDNFLGGLDFGFRTTELFGSHVLTANAFALGSWTEGVSGSDNLAFGSGIALPNDLYSAGIRFYQIDEDFNAALGFVPRRGIRAYSGSFSFRPRLYTVERIRQIYFTYSNSQVTDLSDRLDTALHTLTPLFILFESSDSVYLGGGYQFDAPEDDFEIHPGVLIPAGEYWWPFLRTGFETASKRPVEVEVDYTFGGFYDGVKHTYSAAIDYKPVKHLAIGAGYSLNQVRLPEGDFDTRLASARMRWSFTTELSWHHLLQYDSVSDSVGYNSRIIWEFRPGAHLYLVLNQNHDRDRGRLELVESALTAKVNVTFRF